MGKKYTTDEIGIGNHSLDSTMMDSLASIVGAGLHSDAGYTSNVGTVTTVGVGVGVGLSVSIANRTTEPQITLTNTGYYFQAANTGYVGSGGMQNWNTQESVPNLNPTTDWFTSLRIGHGHPVNYYSNTLGIQMTGADSGRIYTRTIADGTAGSWKKYYHTGDFSAADVANGVTAHGWGNHANAGYLTSYTDTNTTYNFVGSTFTSRNSGNPIAIDSATSNMTGYTNSSAAAGFSDGGLFVAAYSTSWVSQIFSNFRTGELSTRGKNSGTWQAWRRVHDSGHFSTTDVANGVTAHGWGNHAGLYADASHSHAYLPLTGGTLTGTLAANGGINMGNTNLTNVNHITINDPGSGEGIEWTGGNGWKIFESNDSNSNGAGNLQFSVGSVHKFRVDTSGHTTSMGSSRAPIFYDSNDTGYYVNPASTSNLNSVTASQFTGPLTGTASNADLLDGIDSSGFVKALSDSSSPNYQTPSSRRVNPSTSNPTNEHYAVTTFGNNGNVTGQLATHYITGAPYTRGYNSTWSSWQKIWTDANDGSGSGLDADKLDGLNSGQNGANVVLRTASNGYLYINDWIHPANGTGLFYDAGVHFHETGNYMYSNTGLQAANDMRAPVFYDRDNSAYFTNPANTSNLNGLTVQSTITGTTSGNVKQINTSSGDIDADWGTSFKTFDPIPTGTPPIQSPNLRTVNIGENFSRRTQLAFNYSTDQAWFRRRDSSGWQTWREFYHSGNFTPSNYLLTTGKAADSNLLDGIDSGSFIRSDANDSFSGSLSMNTQKALVASNYGHGVYGVYHSYKLQHLWSMGTAYNLHSDGNGQGNLYGIAWSHQNAGTKGGANNLASHGMLILENGVWKGAWGGGSLRTPSDVRAPIFYDLNNTGYYVNPASTSNFNVINATGGTSTEWNTAYDWGNHASAGYVTSSGNTIIGTDSDINTSGAIVVDQLNMTDGVIQSHSTRTMTLGNLGYTGATNANYITNNNQLSNGAGYLTNSNDRNFITDSRGSQRAPSYYNDRYAQWDFQNSADTLAGGDAWHGLLTVAKWSSHHVSHRQEQLIFTGNDLKRRTASSDSAWGSVKTIYDSGNLSLSTLGYTGATNANYITNNNQLTNGAGYTTYTANQALNTSSSPTFNALTLNGDLFVNWDGTSSNIRMGDTDHGERRIHCNSNRIGFLNSSNGWGSYCEDSGNWVTDYISYAGASMRAPIFYDSDDTNYYVNPNARSRFNEIQTTDSGATPRYDTAFYVIQGQHWYGDTSSQVMYLGESSNPVRLRGSLRIGGTGNADSGMGLTVAGSANATSSFRAPIFYDSNNTAYYTNPASTSKLNGLEVQGGDLKMYENGTYSSELRFQNNTHHMGIDYQNNETLRFITRSGVTTVPITFQMRAGTITAANFILSSDERKKTKITDLSCDNIDVAWKSFELKSDEGEYRTGVIAQELEQKHPEFVNTDDKGFKSVKYIDLLIAKIAELEARLEKLEGNGCKKCK